MCGEDLAMKTSREATNTLTSLYGVKIADNKNITSFLQTMKTLHRPKYNNYQRMKIEYETTRIIDNIT